MESGQQHPLMSLNFSRLSVKTLKYLITGANEELIKRKLQPIHRLRAWKSEKIGVRNVQYLMRGKKYNGRYGEVVVNDEYGGVYKFTVAQVMGTTNTMAMTQLAQMAVDFIDRSPDDRSGAPPSPQPAYGGDGTEDDDWSIQPSETTLSHSFDDD